ncbi:MAG: ferritin family protein [bacterium]|nr:ferritin family protein [bacterium]
MTKEVKKSLLKAQQGELDAVVLYRKLAGMIKNEEYKEKFLQVAADEGKHASILKEYTGEVLTPKNRKANLIATMYKVLGAKFTMKLLSNGELKSIDAYAPLVSEFPNIQTIMDDELKHSKVATDYLNSL